MEIDIRNFWHFSLIKINGKKMLQESNRLMPASFEQIDEVYKALINTLEYYNDNSFDSESLEIEEERQKEEYSIECEKRFNQKEITPVHLYLILNESENTLKIGRSKNPEKRIKQLQCATGDKLILLKVANSMGKNEMDTHKKFNHLRLNAEWFKNDDSIIEYFEKIIK